MSGRGSGADTALIRFDSIVKRFGGTLALRGVTLDLRPGEILPAADAYYEHVGGRFRFRGTRSADVTAAIAATARDFRVSAEAV